MKSLISDPLFFIIISIIIPLSIAVLAAIIGPLILNEIQYKSKKRVSRKSIDKETYRIFEKLKEDSYYPTIIIGLRNGGRVISRKLYQLFKEKNHNSKLIIFHHPDDGSFVIQKLIKNTIKRKANSNNESQNEKILIVSGKTYEEEDLKFIENISIYYNNIKVINLIQSDDSKNVFLLDKSYYKAKFPWEIDLQNKHLGRKIFVGIISVIILSLIIFLLLKPKEIKIGIGPFEVESASALQEIYEEDLIKHANKAKELRYSHFPFTRYKFSIHVNQSQNYKDVLSDLKDNNNNIAFVSSNLWAIEKKKYQDSVIQIGFMKEGYSDVYQSWLIGKKENLKVHDIDSIIKYIKEKDIQVYLNEIRESGSTHVIPKIFLLERGINIYDHDKYHINYLRKKDMMNIITKQSNSIGFISSSEYTKQFAKTDTCNWIIYPISIPIPRDPVLVNGEWWNGLQYKERKNILKALSIGNIKCFPLSGNPSDSLIHTKKREIFEDYIASGILFDKENMLFTMIHNEMDKVDNFKNGDTMKLVQFNVYNKNLNAETIGHAIIEYVDSIKKIYRLKDYKIRDGSIEHIHILPIK